MIVHPAEMHPRLSDQLKEAAPLIRSALQRLHARPILLITAEDVPVMNGTLLQIDDADAALPRLAIEFMLRGVVFTMEVPLGRVFDLVGSWTGTHFVFRLPPGNRLSIQLGAPGSR